MGGGHKIFVGYSTYIPELRYSPTRKKGFNKALSRDSGTKQLENIPLNKGPFQKEKVVFQPSLFEGRAVSGFEGVQETRMFWVQGRSGGEI